MALAKARLFRCYKTHLDSNWYQNKRSRKEEEHKNKEVLTNVTIDSSSKHVACSTFSSSIKNDICMMKKSVDCLGFTLSQCAMDHKKLKSMFRKK